MTQCSIREYTKAAAERLDVLLPTTELEENVGKLSAEGKEVECRPYRTKGRIFSKTFALVY